MTSACPTPSFGGERVAFQSNRTARWEIFLVGVDGSGLDPGREVFSLRSDGTDLRRHTSHRAVSTYPSVSPDGRRIVRARGFVRDLRSIEVDSEVLFADLDGSDELNLSSSAAFDC